MGRQLHKAPLGCMVALWSLKCQAPVTSSQLS